MNVFTDFHHASLLKSFILLFEKRMGGNVYRPIGMEWAEQGFWKVYNHPATQAQYLGIGAATPDGTPKLNEVEAWVGEGIGRSLPGDGDIGRATDATVYYCKDIEGNETNKAITLDGFLHLEIDYVIASLPQHIKPFRKLCDQHWNHPKLIYQIGNAWNIEEGDASLINGIMASAKISHPYSVPTIEYHQEFDTNIFTRKPYINNQGIGQWPDDNIYSFVNVFNGQPHFAQDWELFTQIERAMPEWNFKSFGGQCRDGAMNGSQELANKMREARFIWHTKNHGDGYGHVIHNSAAVGRPLIVKAEYYRGKLAESLILPDVTSIVIDGLSNEQIINKITYYSDPERYSQMCRAVYINFKTVVDFDVEYSKIQEFLHSLA